MPRRFEFAEQVLFELDRRVEKNWSGSTRLSELVAKAHLRRAR